MLHTVLRARELCRFRRNHLHVGKRSGEFAIIGTPNTNREAPLNATARAAPAVWLMVLPRDATLLFPSAKTGGRWAT